MSQGATARDDVLLNRLAAWALRQRPERIDKAQAAAAKRCILDALACGLAGLATEPAQRVLQVLRAQGGNPQASVIGTPWRTSIPDAALANATLIRALDLNDFYFGPGYGGHPSDSLSAALAVAQARGRSGADLLTACVIGYELACRWQDLMDPRGAWDNVDSCSLASAAMSAWLLGLDEARFAEALALAAAHSHTLKALRQPQISEAKASSGGRVVRDAVFAALLAEAGVTGPRTALQESFGLRHVLAPRADLAALWPHADERARILDVEIKAYPCVGTSQAAVAAAIELHHSLPPTARDIVAVELHMCDTPTVRSHSDEAMRAPHTQESSDHSLYFLVAVALQDGQLTHAQFQGERWHHAETIALMQRIRVHYDHAPVPQSHFPARIHLSCADGSRHALDMPYAPGHPRNPLTLARVSDKLKLSTGDSTRIARLTGCVASLDEAPDLGPLFQALSP